MQVASRNGAVGLRIEGHAAFVAAVYDLVIANADH